MYGILVDRVVWAQNTEKQNLFQILLFTSIVLHVAFNCGIYKNTLFWYFYKFFFLFFCWIFFFIFFGLFGCHCNSLLLIQLFNCLGIEYWKLYVYAVWSMVLIQLYGCNLFDLERYNFHFSFPFLLITYN